jgi:hypothetical protein
MKAVDDKPKRVKKPSFKKPDKESLREDSLNRYIEAAKVKPLSEFGFEAVVIAFVGLVGAAAAGVAIWNNKNRAVSV